MLRRTPLCNRFLARSSPVLLNYFKKSSLSSFSNSTTTADDDIHWYTKVWKDRAFDGGSSSLKRVDGKSFDDQVKSAFSNTSDTTTDITRLLQMRVGLAKHELDLTHAIPDVICADLVEFYREHCTAPINHSHHLSETEKNQIMKNKITFISDITSLSSFNIDSVSKQSAKLEEYLKQQREQDDEKQESESTRSEKQLRVQSRITALVKSMHQSTEPLHAAWMKRVVSLPSGTKVMINFREDLLEVKKYLQKQKSSATSSDNNSDASSSLHLLAVDTALASCTDILRRWFSTSWMIVDELTWQNTPAAVIEQVIRHEAVHKFLPSVSNTAPQMSSPLDAIKQRMKPSPNRSLFAFFHPHVPSEPIVMLQVAYCYNGCYASSVDRILQRNGIFDEQNNPHCASIMNKLHPIDVYRGTESSSALSSPDTAIFYSISSTQKGLAGIELGKHLIKRAVKQVLVETRKEDANKHNNNNHLQSSSESSIKKFSTLSPIPGYVRWATANCRQSGVVGKSGETSSSIVDTFVAAFFVPDFKPKSVEEKNKIQAAGKKLFEVLERLNGGETKFHNASDALNLFWNIMQKGNKLLLSAESTTNIQENWVQNFKKDLPLESSKLIQNMIKLGDDEATKSTSPALWTFHPEFCSAATDFLQLSVKHYLLDVKRRGKVFDPVGHFHLRNGACLFRINTLADCTVNGSSNSCCFMVNYEYDLSKIDERSTNYETHGTVYKGDEIKE